MKAERSRPDLPEKRSAAPAPYIAMHAAGASPHEVFSRARIDGYKELDCAFIVAGLFDMPFREARRLRLALDGEQGR